MDYRKERTLNTSRDVIAVRARADNTAGYRKHAEVAHLDGCKPVLVGANVPSARPPSFRDTTRILQSGGYVFEDLLVRTARLTRLASRNCIPASWFVECGSICGNSTQVLLFSAESNLLNSQQTSQNNISRLYNELHRAARQQ